MGQVLDTLQSKFRKDKCNRIIIRGLGQSGKTTIMYWLKENRRIKSLPTIGINVEQININNIVFELYDIGLEDLQSTNRVWRHYYENTKGVIYVIDLSDKKNFENIVKDIKQLNSESDLNKKPFLIFGNKSDMVHNNISEFDILQDYGLNDIKHSFLQVCSGKTGEGIQEGFENYISQFKFK